MPKLSSYSIEWNNHLSENESNIKKKLINNFKYFINSDGDFSLNENGIEIGPVKFEGYIFDRDAFVLKLGLSDKQGLKEYLDTNGGVRVYRDGLRVYDYGEVGNDWLNLDIRRVNQPGKNLVITLFLELFLWIGLQVKVLLKKQTEKDLLKTKHIICLKTLYFML